MLSVLGLAVLLTLSIVSCNKDEVVEQQTPIITEKSNMSLNEFISTVESEEEKAFFENHEIIDNRVICEKALKNFSSLKAEVAKPRIKFKWGGNGCVNPIGICLIIPIGAAEANAEAFVQDGKYIVVPSTDDNGITNDGYLPIYEDVYVDENTTVKAGIYTANYDSQSGKYSAIALDVK